MPCEENMLLDCNQHLRSLKVLSIIYEDLESLIKKIRECKKILGKSSTIKPGKHIPCGYSMSAIWGFDDIKIKYDFYREKGCMKKF